MPIDLKAARAWLLIQDSLEPQDYLDFLNLHGTSPQADLARAQLEQLNEYAAIDRLATRGIHDFIIKGPFMAVGTLAKLERNEHNWYFSESKSLRCLFGMEYNNGIASAAQVARLDELIGRNKTLAKEIDDVMMRLLEDYRRVPPARRMSSDGKALEPALSLKMVAKRACNIIPKLSQFPSSEVLAIFLNDRA